MMKRTRLVHGWRWGVALVVFCGVIALMLLPKRGIIQRLSTLTGHLDIGDALGHAGLFALLTFVGYVAARGHLRHRRALLLTVVACLALGWVTEHGQRFAPGRTVSLSDLLANWLGVVAAAALIGYYQAKD